MSTLADRRQAASLNIASREPASFFEPPSETKPSHAMLSGAHFADAKDLGAADMAAANRSASITPARPRGLLSGAELKTGCLPRNEFLDQALNRTLAALLLLATLPIFLIVALAVLISSGRPIFYSGARFGKGRKQFNILKFRTLDTRLAAKLTADKTLPRRNNTVTAIGYYLRASRLDELPQLINVLRGEMVFFGPRPVRPEVEGVYEVTSPAHMIRFNVRPGLVGLSQAIMTHETPKAARARFNRMCCKTEIRYRYLLLFVARVGYQVIAKSIRMCASALFGRIVGVKNEIWLSNGFNRPRNCRIKLQVGNEEVWGAVAGASDELIQFISNLPVEPGHYDAVVVARRGKSRVRNARMQLHIFQSQPCGVGVSGFVHYCTYTAPSNSSRQVVERYILQSSVVPA